MIFSLMRALKREHIHHFKMTSIDDAKDYSISLEEREKQDEQDNK